VTTRQLLNRNSYVLLSAVVLMVAAYFVARLQTWTAWLAWIVAVALLYTGFLLLRIGSGTRLGEEEIDKLVGNGKVPVVLQLFSNY
jgi:ABC-type multidrug transport system permease subunit